MMMYVFHNQECGTNKEVEKKQCSADDCGDEGVSGGERGVDVSVRKCECE